MYVNACRLCHYKFICTNLKNAPSCGKLDYSLIPQNKLFNIVHFYAHSASTKRAFEMPGHGSPPNFLLDTEMVHFLFPMQAYKSHYKRISKSI